MAAGMIPAASGQTQFGSMLWDYVREYLRLLDERRAARLAALESKGDFLALRQRVREELARMWGPFPQRTPLNAKQVGTLDRKDHIVERIIFESRPSFHVTANLYRPKAPGEGLPAVIFPCGHGEGGKIAETYRRFAGLMARNGFAVLTWDPVGQGERLQFRDVSQSGWYRPGQLIVRQVNLNKVSEGTDPGWYPSAQPVAGEIQPLQVRQEPQFLRDWSGQLVFGEV